MKKLLILITTISVLFLSGCSFMVSTSISNQGQASGKMVETETSSTHFFMLGAPDLSIGNALAKQCKGEVKNITTQVHAVNYLIIPMIKYKLTAKGQCK